MPTKLCPSRKVAFGVPRNTSLPWSSSCRRARSAAVACCGGTSFVESGRFADLLIGQPGVVQDRHGGRSGSLSSPTTRCAASEAGEVIRGMRTYPALRRGPEQPERLGGDPGHARVEVQEPVACQPRLVPHRRPV